MVDCGPHLKLFMQSGTFVRNSYQAFLYCQKTWVYMAAFPAVEGENRGEEDDVLSDGLSLPTSACGIEGTVPLRTHMEIAVTSRIFPNGLGHKCLEEVEILALQKLSFPPVKCLLPQLSAETSNQCSHCQAAPRGDIPGARPATALRQGQRVLQRHAPPAALVLQFAW